MGDIKVSEGFLDAIMIRVTATGVAATGLVPTCTVMKLSDGTTTVLTVAELTLGVYKATDWTPNADTEYMTIWAVAGANTIYTPFKLFKVGGGRVEDIVDAIGSDGITLASHDYSDLTIMGRLHGQHNEAVILFVIPEAVGAINAHNTVIQTELGKLGEVITITQADALAYPDMGMLNLIVLGTDNGTGWATANLADIKSHPGAPILCVDATTAAYFEMGTDGGDAAAKTAINAVANIEGSILGGGWHDLVGLAAGANTVSSAATYNTLDMSDVDITETWFAYESVNANTDVVLAIIRSIQLDGTIGIDEEGTEINQTLAFYGPAYSANNLNTLGKAVLVILGHTLIMETTIGGHALLEGQMEALTKKLLGNVRGKLSNTVPMAAFLIGNSGGAGTELPNSISLYDVVRYLYHIAHPSGDPTADSILDLIMNKGAGQTFARATDSLEALSEAVAAIAGDATAANQATIIALLDSEIADIIADIGVFPTGNYATIAAYVEDIRTRLIAILADVTGLNGDVMRGTDGGATAAIWTNALATALTSYTAARAAYLDELAAANIPADIDTLLGRVTAAVALASVCTETRLAELAAANLPADIDTLLTRVTAAVATATALATVDTNVDTLITRVTAAVALASVCTEVRLNELTAANMPADIDTLVSRVTAAVATATALATVDTNVDTILGRVTAAVALASVCTEARLARLTADVATEAKQDIIDGLIDDIIADIGVFPSANYATLAAYVEDIRARLIVILADVTGLNGDAMRGTDGAALVASGWDAALATILDNFTALRIGYLDELDFDLAAALALLATEAKQDIIDGNVDDIELRVQYLVNKNIFWSLYQEEVQLTSVAADVNLPNVVLPNITGTIVRVYGVFKFRAIENTNAAVNAVNVAQAIRIKKSTGAWGVDDVALIDIPDNMFSVAALSREMGDVMAGENEVHGEVDIFNATYNVRWENGDVDQNNMNFNDVQVGLIVEWY